MGEKYGENCTDPQQVLNFESVDVGIMSRLVVVQHEIDYVSGGANEEKLECREV